MHHLLYGGTFDPIHHGHLITCRRARELLNAHSVLLIPAALSPHKTNRPLATTTDHRINMLKLAIQSDPTFQLDTRECQRPAPSYTADTIDSLLSENPSLQLTLLVGSDQLPKFHTWHRIHSIINRIPIAILPRAGDGQSQNTPTNLDLTSALAATQKLLPTARLQLLPTPTIDISATDIRTRLQQNLPITYLVPPHVETYIQSNNLYR